MADRIVVFSDRPNSEIKGIIKDELPRPRNQREKVFFDIEDEIIKNFS
jgi:ABC-type nitrate/sulfonate/bicarbonate transport system ATPase subunit